MTDLLPCPFCGDAEARVVASDNPDVACWFKRCWKCGRMAQAKTAEEIDEQWNTRANHIPDAGEMVEVAKDWKNIAQSFTIDIAKIPAFAERDKKIAELKRLLKWCVDNFAELEFEDGFPDLAKLPDCPEKQAIEEICKQDS